MVTYELWYIQHLCREVGWAATPLAAPLAWVSQAQSADHVLKLLCIYNIKAYVGYGKAVEL